MWAGTGRMTPGDHGFVGVSSTFHPLSALLIHMHITLTNSTLNFLSPPPLSGRWWELLNIYEAFQSLVLLWC